ncbi:MAG: DUF6946 family protein, partial [Kiloniellales bacterium]
MEKFFHKIPLRRPEDAQALIRRPERLWQPGLPAKELAESWLRANDFPKAVRALLDSCPAYRQAVLSEAYFARRSQGGDGETRGPFDLLAYGNSIVGPYVIAVEGRREESFGERAGDWARTAARQRQLEGLCRLLRLEPEAAARLRLRLLRRCVGLLFEAAGVKSGQALLLVHSFSPRKSGIGDFKALTRALGAPLDGPGEIGPA